MELQEPNRMELLHFAARDGERDMLEFLLTAGVDVNTPAGSGWTPLHFAAARGHTFVVEFLLDKGANPGAETAEGYTPLDLALHYEHTSVAQLLRNYPKHPRRRGPHSR